MDAGLGRVRLHEREAVRALWRGHFEAWRLSGLTQREYCERHGVSLKSFRNWRGQLKREDVAGRDARWGRHPRLRHMVSPMATPMATRLRMACRRSSPERAADVNSAKRTSDASSRRPVDRASRCRRSHAAAELTCAYCSGGGEPWGLADQLRRQALCRSSAVVSVLKRRGCVGLGKGAVEL